jgi:hypothetical protein
MNGLARVFVSFVPFAVIAMAAGFHALKFRYKHLLVAAAFIGLMGGSYAYAYTYRNIRDPYLPFFDEMRQRIAGGANVVMPFNIQDCVYFSQRKCLRIGNTGGIPTPTKDTLDSIITDYGVEYVCCSSLNIQALSDSDRLICQRFEGKRPYIDYEAQGVWGKCWGT